ncbi:MAG: YerC/YecD family TrpR-related protein [Pseudomonadota bacterium]
MKSNRPFSKSQENAEEHALYEAILTLRTVDECQRFFRDLCSPAELQALKDRWHVVGLLEQGQAYRSIQAQTGVSVTTIGRIRRFLDEGFGGYRLVRDRVLQGNRPS